ncbi:polysaccharide deacetylase family protein [Nocardioides kribbensis]|uniref:Polysaccharide deacetylase family protein n=1 Tax=Nocardioides kribbensis TaxID=305517 RepID=A0ABV1P3J6_9ACTN
MAEPRPATTGSTAAPGRRSPLRPSRSTVVLMYHGFCTTRRADDPENLFVEVARLEEQLTWLLAHGWEALDLDGYRDVRAGRRSGHRTVLVTIDDGFDSVADLAAPVLHRLGVPAVLFVPSGLVGATATWLPEPASSPLLQPERLRGLPALGVEIGLHGRDHRDLRGIDPEELHRQTALARAELADFLGAPAARCVRSFAYPYGAHDRAARDAVAAAGFLEAFSVFDDAGPMAVSRVDVNATDTLRSFRVKLMPQYRRAWRALESAPALRRLVHKVSTRTPNRTPDGPPEAAPTAVPSEPPVAEAPVAEAPEQAASEPTPIRRPPRTGTAPTTTSATTSTHRTTTQRAAFASAPEPDPSTGTTPPADGRGPRG